jgi:transposase-like protein/regulator of replication initiation timing
VLQTYIPYSSKNATPINEKMAMDSDDEQVVFFTATGPVYSFRKNDKFAKRLAQGILVSLGLATTAELAKALGINRTTVLKNVQRYKDKGPEGFIDNRFNRSPYKLNKEKQQVVKRLLDKGSTITAAAAEVGVSEGCVRRALRKGLIVRKTTQPDQTKESVELKGPAKRSKEDANCNAGIATKREEERLLARKGDLIEALPKFLPNEGVHYAGVLLALPFLAGLSYLSTGKKVYGALKNAYYGLQSILLTLAFMALLRMKNPEQLKNGNPGDFGIILGLDRCPEVKTLRRKLNELGLHNQSGQFMETLSREWVEQDKDILGFSYIDGHVRPYHGRKHTLPKTHVARRRLCMPATTDFWVNGTHCEPLFFVTTEANNSLLSTVENEIIPELKRLSKGERVTLVFDREGWSPDRFLKWRKSDIDVLTYRKGKYEPWQKDCFVEVISQVRGEPVTYLLGERSIKINKKGWVREVRRLCDNGHQTSVISTRQDLPMEEIARRMFFRWNQENYFKYMRDEYGLDHLVSRDVEQADVERMVPNPQKKELLKEHSKQLKQLKKKKEHYAKKAVDNDEKQCRTMRGFNISNYGLKTEIKQMEEEIETLKAQIKQLPDKVKINEMLEEDEIVRLETEKKRLTDTIKMTCYRAETELLKIIEQNHCFAKSMDEGRTFIKKVFQQPADMIPNDNEGRLEIRFHTMSTRRENKSLAELCDIVNKENFLYPGTKLKLVFKAA